MGLTPEIRDGLGLIADDKHRALPLRDGCVVVIRGRDVPTPGKKTVRFINEGLAISDRREPKDEPPTLSFPLCFARATPTDLRFFPLLRKLAERAQTVQHGSVVRLTSYAEVKPHVVRRHRDLLRHNLM